MKKFYIIGVRDNPQLGSYLSMAKVAEAKVNKTHIRATYEDLGSKQSLRFALEEHAGVHRCITSQKCAYGGYTYFGFSKKENAIKELTRWSKLLTSSGKRAKEALKIFENS